MASLKFPCAIMQPLLASRNRCYSFRGIFLLEVATNGADGRAGTNWRKGQNPAVLRFCRELDRIDADRRAAPGVRDRIERAPGSAVHYGAHFSPFPRLHDPFLRLLLPPPPHS